MRILARTTEMINLLYNVNFCEKCMLHPVFLTSVAVRCCFEDELLGVATCNLKGFDLQYKKKQFSGKYLHSVI